jgi:hypothetical protein
MNKSTLTRRVPLPVNPEVDVVWHGGLRSPSGQVGQLLPETHNVSSTWGPSVRRLREGLDAINERDLG